MASSWIRITAAEGVVIGKLEVPTRCPWWFLDQAKAMCEVHGRIEKPDDLMKEIDPKQWLSILYSHHQMIPLRKPLAPEQQEEFVLFPPGKWEEMQAKFNKIGKETNETTAMAWRRTMGERVQEFGVLSLEQRDKIPQNEADQWNMVPMSAAFGKQGRMFVSYMPMLQTQGVDRDIDDETFITWETVTLWNIIKNPEEWDRMADGHYGGGVKIAKGVPQAFPHP